MRAGAEQVETPVISVNFATWTLNGRRMSRSDYALIQVFIERPGESCHEARALECALGSIPQNDYGQFTSRALDAAVSRLRRKGVPLINVWGVGWLLPHGAVEHARADETPPRDRVSEDSEIPSAA